MIKTIVREHHWPPAQINKLKVYGWDNDDTDSLEFWYHDVLACIKEMESKMPKKK